MKTILDVVKEFKGEVDVSLCGGDFSLYYNKDSKFCAWVWSNEPYHERDLICTVGEYSDYVTSLSHHAGKELFVQYLAVDKTPLEKKTMTKTILDAVKHYRGVAIHDGVDSPIWYNYVSYNDRNGFYLSQYRTKHFLCSRMEFNWCVERLATNYGKCSQSYAEYKSDYGSIQLSAEREKETKVDYTSEEFWKDAPEGATHWDNVARVFCNQKGYWFLNNANKYIKDDEQNIWGDPSRYEPRPQPKLIYTQEMADKGEMPSVGMECLFKMNGEYKAITVLYNSQEAMVFSYIFDGVRVEDARVKSFNNIDIKPIDTRSDKEKAIDEVLTVFLPEDKAIALAALTLAYNKWVGK